MYERGTRQTVTGRSLLRVAGLSLAVALAVAAPRAMQAISGGPPDRAAVVGQFLAAWSRGDLDGAMALVTDDVTYIAGPDCTLQAPCRGAAALRAFVEDEIRSGQTFTVTELRAVGSGVQGRWEIRNERIREAGVERVVVNNLSQVPRDKITVFVSLFDLTDPQTAQRAGLPAPVPPGP